MQHPRGQPEQRNTRMRLGTKPKKEEEEEEEEDKEDKEDKDEG